MAGLAPIRRRLSILSIAFAVIALLAMIYVFVPLGPNHDQRVEQLNSAQLEYKRLEEQVSPLRSLPQKLNTTRTDISKFYRDRLPDRFSAVPEEVGKIAAKSGVKLSGVKYEILETEVPNLEMISLQANLSGDYGSIVKFINAVERNKIFFLITGVSLAEESGGAVKLQITMESYQPSSGTASPRPSQQKAGARS